MRKSLLILLQTIMFAMPLFAERVDEKTAQKVGETFLKSKMSGKTDLKIAQVAYANRADFSNFYVFGGENCFVIVSADDCVKPILGYSDENPFGTEAMPENVYGWLKDYDNQIQIAADSKLAASEEIRSEWQNLKEGKAPATKSMVIVGPLIQTKWDQGSPYNSYCPKVGTTSTYTGCVATAMAQVMKYWNYPSQGVGSHSYTWNGQTLSADFGATIYDWTNMTNTISTSSPSDVKTAVATLMYHCGVSVEMDYGTGGSGAVSSKVPAALIEHFRYSPSASFESRSSYSNEDWKALLKSELDEARPLYYSGNNPSSGHAFVCDGYRDDDYFHFNWGWSGSRDGYFLMDHLNPGSGGSGSGAGTYNLSNAIIAHLEPLSSMSAPVVSSLAGQDAITISWTSVAGATSYDLYKDNVKIAVGLTGTSFEDENVEFGIRYQYYVRAVASGGLKSNPSNVTVSFVSSHDPVPTSLAASSLNNTVALSWTAPASKSLEIYYGLNYGGGYYGYAGQNETYWGQKYLASSLTNYSGMEINRVSFYAAFTGNYTLYLYKTNTSSSNNKLLEQQYTAQNIGWQNIILQTPVVLDCSKDLWVVFKAGTEITHPAAYGEYNGSDVANARHISSSLASVTSGYVNANISWLINIQLSDGTFLFDVYRDDQMIAENLSATQYTDEGLEDGTYDYYVKSVSNGHLSSASETVSATVLTHHVVSSDAVINEDLNVHQFNQYVVAANTTLTVNGELTCSDPQYLILEDNAQLIHSTSGVQATVQKSITGYGEGNGNWYLVASPMVGDVSTAPFVSDYYDLYRYNEPTHYWWNSKTPASGEGENGEDHHFDELTNGVGYLYGNGIGCTLSLEGELQPSNDPVVVGLSKVSDKLAGFNLIGNPFPCQASVSGDIAEDFYVMNEEGDQLELATDDVVNPFEGIFVQATGENANAAFSRVVNNAKGRTVSSYFDITVNEGRSEIDRARVRIGKGVGLGKFSLNENSARIYIPMDKQDYASAYVSGRNVLPLNFEPTKNGTYTLDFDLSRVDLGYLHLIDNLTGADIDVLATSTYTFDARTTDYSSRFKLVFAEKQQADDSENTDFMYYSDGKMFIFGAEENGTLQIIDAAGRVIMTEDVNGYASTTMSLQPGVYVARMFSDNVVKTQKFVVK